MPFSFPSSPQPFAQSLHFSFFLSFFVLFFLSLLHFWHLSWLSFFKVVFSYSALISCQALCLCLLVLLVSWYLASAPCLILLSLRIDFFDLPFCLLYLALRFPFLFLFLFFSHSAGVCIGYQPILCWSHVYAPLSYILLYLFFLPLAL